ncbi:hypothetical protein LU699_13415 [Luteimonas fraxinea]|uniref:Uncharacterized protein n=1 Tax=Luteimonas fraxinea TaxID=2901869 RepID=A0ABS8UER0_9GAMM|nr:hypothetical protein [Luteimonas fraxinea]MCD9097986.1 hypothetical protein [Luteimonas fraxinea]UHH09284.1 hypothetical protein LU699_13415 [Luteimonas fraxinea]
MHDANIDRRVRRPRIFCANRSRNRANASRAVQPDLRCGRVGDPFFTMPEMPAHATSKCMQHKRADALMPFFMMFCESVSCAMHAAAHWIAPRAWHRGAASPDMRAGGSEEKLQRPVDSRKNRD